MFTASATPARCTVSVVMAVAEVGAGLEGTLGRTRW